MICSNPYKEGVMEHGCGQCLPCRINRRRLWTGRLLLESCLYPVSAFITLTYDEDHVPSQLVPRDMQLFLKRLRKRLSPQKVRFYGVGEYGDVSMRPHFHLIVFGLGALVVGRHKLDCSCVVCGAWGKGMCHVGEVTPESIAYTVQYVTKRMTNREDKRLGGKHPEFSRMSLRPGGIGAGAVGAILESLTGKAGADYVARMGDVPGRFRSSGRMWPLGRYLLGKLRADYGMDKGTIDRLSALRGWSVQSELRVKGAANMHEQKRLQHARRAKVLDSLSRSKKGVGL